MVYIGGHGRSGSTLLERMLGQLDDFVAVGELRHLLNRGLDENQLCGCGTRFWECEFWRGVVKEVFGSRDDIPFAEFHELKRRVDRTRYIPHMFLAGSGSGYRKRCDRYSDVRLRLYRAIEKQSGGKVIVDSSKDSSSLYLLARQKEIDLHVVHLIRDSRAVAFSWLRKKARPEITWKTAYMPNYSPRRTALEWVVRNAVVELSRGLVTTYRRVRYEDLVADPRRTVERIVSDIVSSAPDLSIFRGTTVSLARPNHTVAGNPMRFETGNIELREDREWRSRMSSGARRLVTVLTAPALLRYGYPLVPRRQTAGSTAESRNA